MGQVPVQVPGEATRLWPSWDVPEMVGTVESCGGPCLSTQAVGVEVAQALP
jgi:hypothetical protein